MSVSVVPYTRELLDDIVAIFNREHAPFEFVAPLSPELFETQLAAKSVFSAEGCPILMQGAKAVGFALTCCKQEIGAAKPDLTVGVIDGMFFPSDRLDLGEQLLRHCLSHLRARGARTTYGFASHGGYPFWRGLYMGLEPVCLTAYTHMWIAFMGAGFEHHQQSLNYLGPPRGLPYRQDLEYRLADVHVSDAWESDSWRGHRPQRLAACIDGEQVGAISFAELPFLSDHRGLSVAGISGMSVIPNMRRQGIASSLMGRLFDVLSDAGVNEILVGTTVQNAAARRTYEKAGMRVIAFRTGTRRAVDRPVV